ncbi:S-adenosyl-L-methionine-dependent methyltransferases superfamily protein [Wolffia australiana]
MLAVRLHPAFSPSKKHNNSPVRCDATRPPNVGRIKRLVLTPEGRTKLNSTPDRDFYSFPRFVKHVDDGFLTELTKLYEERLPPGGDVLDIMSSWVSHLPPEVKYRRVVGHGLNAQELARNPRFESFFVKDLNREQELAFESCSFDAVVCAVSVQYMQWPEKVFAEVLRILKPGGVFIISFSDRMFYEKAITAWRDGTTYSRIQLVVQYFQCVEGFTEAEVIKRIPGQERRSLLQSIAGLLGYSRSDPFYAVVAYRNFKPISDS